MSVSKYVKLVLPIAVLLASEAKATEWIPLPGDNYTGSIFVDRSSIRKYNGIVRVWMMDNPELPDSHPIGSMKSAILLDCQTWESAIQAIFSYSEPNGQGQIIRSNTIKPYDIDYTPAIPGTPGDTLLTMICDNSR